jgi:hypothetical protein
LRILREKELARMLHYHTKGDQSHRTVIVMCDDYTSQLLSLARHAILEPLHYSTDAVTSGVWIPKQHIVPSEDLHVTVAIPWWWHTMRPQNAELTQELVARFRHAVHVEFHYPFQLELERIVLLGGKALVALWTCIGERRTEDGAGVIYDRHGQGVDPFVKLRRDIVRCFTAEDDYFGKEPLTYTHRHATDNGGATQTPLSPQGREEPDLVSEPPGKRLVVERQNSIELKTPGLLHLDGFIHTTLARLPVDCLSTQDVELGDIHRLCREATATYGGHRMVVSKFRFLETTGAGGESNPCVEPIFDETIHAPVPISVNPSTGGISEHHDMGIHADKTVKWRNTIGAPPQGVDRPSLQGLFEDPLETEDPAVC